jgi:hypothetical protein
VLGRAARSLAPLALLCVLAAGCGGGADGRATLDRTLGRLGRIGSGDLRGSLTLTPRGVGGKTEGIEISGPFAFANPGELPVARLSYTRVDGGRRTTLGLVSTGNRAFVVRDGKAYELPRAQVEQLASAVHALPSSSGLIRQRVDAWAHSPKRTACGSLGGGQDVECVRAGLDAQTFVDDLVGVAQLLGRGNQTLGAVDPGELARAVRSGTVRVAAGRQDGLFRGLAVDLDFGPTTAGLSTLLGSLVGAHLHLGLELSSPNRPVIVQPPPNPLPLSQLGSASSASS